MDVKLKSRSEALNFVQSVRPLTLVIALIKQRWMAGIREPAERTIIFGEFRKLVVLSPPFDSGNPP
jgi:hypothetical protein